MKIKNLLILGLVLLGFSYCSSDDALDEPTTGTEAVDGVKMQLTIGMPQTRTSSPTADVLVGSTEENKVNTVLVAIFDASGNSLVATHTATVTSGLVTPEFLINGLTIGNTYKVLAFVNPYSGLETTILSTKKELGKFTSTETLVEKTINAVTKGTEEARTNFFMSNSEVATTAQVSASHTQGSPLNVTVKVQRAVARFDYGDLSRGEIEKAFEAESNLGQAGLKVKFTHFKPMNVSKSFYDLKRVNDGSADGAIGLFGAESETNYVVDTDWATKIGDGPWATNYNAYMGTAVGSNAGGANYVALDQKFYATENTLPAIKNNTKGIATAIVFKGELSADNMTGWANNVYVWNNTFYEKFADLPQVIKDITETNLQGLVASGVTRYSKVGGVYPIYYTYYNVHNQNTGTDPFVGAMEHGVVRNNVYKLSIVKLNKLGAPNDPEVKVVYPNAAGDGFVDENGNSVSEPNLPKDESDIVIVSNPNPKPEVPTDPIKTKDLYMTVTAQILDWTLRTNEIEF